MEAQFRNVSIPVPEIAAMYRELISGIAVTYHGSLRSIEECIALIEGNVGGLRAFMKDHHFEKLDDEIYFFKRIKPAFCSQLMYFRKMYRMVLHKPVGSTAEQVKYLNRELGFLHYYFEANIDLYLYLRSEATYLDEVYFTRKPQAVVSMLRGTAIDGDPTFCTSCDHEVTRIWANDLLKEYIVQSLEELNRKESTGAASLEDRSPLTWTASLAAINELIYGLKATGAINNGNVTLSQIAGMFEKMLNVKVGNYYRRQQENRLRENRTPFLHSMIKKSNEEMDFRDENPHRSSK